MKIFITLFIISASFLFSNNANLNIDYNIGGEKLELDKVYTNQDNIDYKINRFEYYISSVKLDGNLLDGLYILANGNQPKYNLGEINQDVINIVEFDLGVDAFNNIGVDPNSYPAEHPLAPQNPPMHWGWAAGYRFWAVQGYSDPDGDGVFDKSFQYHVLGDDALRNVKINSTFEEVDGDIDINLNFDIEKLISIIDMSDFSVFHGFSQQFPEIKEFIEHINSYDVIVPSSTTSVENMIDLELFPNPVISSLNLKGEIENARYEILDLSGKSVLEGSADSRFINVNELKSGSYFLVVKRNNEIIANKRFVKY